MKKLVTVLSKQKELQKLYLQDNALQSGALVRILTAIKASQSVNTLRVIYLSDAFWSTQESWEGLASLLDETFSLQICNIEP